MFKRNVQTLDNVINQFLRKEGLETPLLQKRLIDAWEKVTGAVVERYTGEKFIKNQTLFVKINNPALTAQVLVNVARASMRQQPGCYTMIEIPVIDLLPGDREEIVGHLV